MEAKDYTMPYWLDEATGITYAKDDPTCGGAGQVHRGPAGQGCDYTCDDCHGSGVVPADDCPEDVAKLIRDDNQRRVFNADQDWADPQGDDEDVYGEDDDRAAPREPEDDEEICPVCGGWGGESYGSDSGTCPECGGSGCVGANWGEGEEEE